jgi:hypothetical protein
MSAQTSFSGARDISSSRDLARPRLRRAALGMVVGLLIQFTAGMLVNLFTKIPDSHPGSNPTEYFSGAAQSVIWAISQSGLPALIFHATWGLLLMINGVVLIGLAHRIGRRAITATAVLGFVAVLAAGFNGASFLNYREDFSSMIMASCFAIAMLAYASLLYQLPA